MYTRVPSGRMPRGMRVPENYSGNAFRPHEMPPPPTPPPQEPPQKDLQPSEAPPLPEAPPAEAPPAEAPPPEKPTLLGLRLPFSGFHLGVEELLLIGLILMIAQEGENDEIIWLLLLLLFIPK